MDITNTHKQHLNNLIDSVVANNKLSTFALSLVNNNDTRGAIKMNTDLITSKQLANIIGFFQTNGYSVQIFGTAIALERRI